MPAAEHALSFVEPDRARDPALVRRWLYAVALLIVAMVVVGGATRLTQSGLSITEWQPIHGVVPPVSAAEWQDEFQKYQEIPQFKLLNPEMTLGEFKGIFWWEWGHRLLGRLIGLVVVVPLIFLIATGRIERALVPKLAAIFVLGGIQGLVGWWMVNSGLGERVSVSQYRLAVHLTFACGLLAYVLWVARGLRPTTSVAPRRLQRTAALIVALVLIQIFLGGIVAGLHAGLISDTWPLMQGSIIPPDLATGTPLWRNLFENPVTAQFDHRLVAYAVFLVAVVQLLQARGTPYQRKALVLLGIVTLQAGLGIATILVSVPLWLALLHQFVAIGVLSHAVLNLRSMTPTGASLAKAAA
jgi:cytochrome c oxidase assembly protein subunit 15